MYFSALFFLSWSSFTVMTSGLTYRFEGEIASSRRRCLVSKILSATTNTESTIIVYDDANVNKVSTFSSMLGSSQRLWFNDERTFHVFLSHHMEKLMQSGDLDNFYNELNFLVICGSECIRSLLCLVTNLDNTTGQGSLLRHFSTWLIISHGPPPHLNITLDNVAVMKLKQEVSSLNPTFKRNMVSLKRTHINFREIKKENIQGIWECWDIDLFTLLWMPDGREWSRVRQCNLSDDQLYMVIFPNKQRGLNGRELVLATLEWIPDIITEIVNETVTYSGGGIEVMDNLGQKFNFSYRIIEPRDGRWGQVLENGTSTGVMGIIHRQEADMCPVSYGISVWRLLAMDFSSPIRGSQHYVMYRRRSDDSYSWMYLLSCFTWPVYLCGLASLVWIVLIIFYINCQGRLSMDLSRNKSHLDRCLEIGTHIPFRQDILQIPENMSSRIILFTWCIFCLIMASVYTGNLVAFTTVDKHKPPFTTLQELAEHDEYAITFFEGLYAENVLMNTDDPLLQRIYSKSLTAIKSIETNSSMDETITHLIQKLLEEKTAFIALGDTKNMIRSKTCDVVSMKETIFPFHLGYIYPRFSPLRQLFDKQLSLLYEMGLINRWREKWLAKAKICDPSRHLHQFKLDQLKSVLVICAAGILVATVVLLVERQKKQTHSLG